MEEINASTTTLLKRPVSLVLTLVIVGLLVSYFVLRWDEISAWLSVQPEFVMALVVLVYTSVVISGFLNQIILKHFNLDLSVGEWLPITFIVTALNTLLPSGSGAAVRAVYLKKNYGFAFADSTSGFLFSNMVSILANAVLGLGLALSLGDFSQSSGGVFTFVFLSIALVVILIIFLPSLRVFRHALEKSPRQTSETSPKNEGESNLGCRFAGFRDRILENIISVNRGFKSLRTHKAIIVQTACLALFNTVLYGLRIYLAFWCINQPVSMTYCLIAGVLASLSLAFSVTPGGLGVREGLLIVAAMLFGIDFEHTLVAITIERIVTTISAWAAAPVCLHRLNLRL